MIMKHDYPHLSWGFYADCLVKRAMPTMIIYGEARTTLLKRKLFCSLFYEIRRSLPRLGTRKMLFLLQPQLSSHNIEVGRDYLFDLFDAHRLLIRQR